MDNSKFNLWRACFSFCFVDGFLSPEEFKWIEEKIKALTFTEEQRSILMRDLASPPDIEKLMPLITKPADRGFLVNQIRILTRLDYQVSEAEKNKIDFVSKAILSKVDLVNLNQVIAADEKASYHEDEVYKVDNKHSFVEKIIKSLMKQANPGDYKFPKN